MRDRKGPAHGRGGPGVDVEGNHALNTPEFTASIATPQTHERPKAVWPIALSLMRSVEDERQALGLPSWQLEDRAGLQDGHYQKLLHCDKPSGRTPSWQSLQLLVEAIFPDGFDIQIRRKPGANLLASTHSSLAASSHSEKIRHGIALRDPRTRREIMRALSEKGASKGGQARARNLTKRQLREIGKKGAAARWTRHRARLAAINGGPQS